MPAGSNQRVGRWGEWEAEKYLTSLGYHIDARNLRTPYGEIDLLVSRDGLSVFVEVKSRESSFLGPPEISVGARKQAHMVACAEHYAQQNSLEHWRIDVIAVQKIKGQPRITHFENAIS